MVLLQKRGIEIYFWKRMMGKERGRQAVMWLATFSRYETTLRDEGAEGPGAGGVVCFKNHITAVARQPIMSCEGSGLCDLVALQISRRSEH